jgi:large conductance mechanosensitive channel
MKGFRKFLMQGNIIDLAVAVVIGVAFNAVVQALVKDMITPLITAIIGDHIISFLLIAAVVYWFIVAPSAKMTALANRNKAATDRPCPECLSTIPIGAKRCMYCTTDVPPVAPPTDVRPPRRPRHGFLAPE